MPFINHDYDVFWNPYGGNPYEPAQQAFTMRYIQQFNSGTFSLPKQPSNRFSVQWISGKPRFISGNYYGCETKRQAIAAAEQENKNLRSNCLRSMNNLMSELSKYKHREEELTKFKEEFEKLKKDN